MRAVVARRASRVWRVSDMVVGTWFRSGDGFEAWCSPRMRRRTLTVCLLDSTIWALVAIATFLSGSDAATKALDSAAGLAVTALLAVTAVPAFALTQLGRAPRTALGL